ncbi:F-box only protein 43 [Dermochelys coriacea]|uniref:F-box only protein 43 n=1 Tax=Dermochelys coriacea TaxID=27794 RepID=UPI0018E7419E|nr:F-box only protein 43 [Dermochelys coriacea]XP_038247260.1 F-box only protein 43 [Dermochelys coriacea]XP_038247261.1 F-box only protein 43 [Dermochelys coriacea]
MSESRSVLSILKRGRLTSPSNNVKYSSFRDSCSTSIFHDRGKDPNFDHTDAEHKDELSTRCLSLLHEYSEHSHPNLVIPVLSPIENENNSISLSERKEANVTTDFLETPKVSKKDSSLRRRLLLSKTALGGTVGFFERQVNSSDCSRKKTSCVLSFEEKLSKSSSCSPRDNTYKPLATSTLKTEESSPACQKLRLAFSQQRTSTVDDTKCKNNFLSEPECLSPIHHNTSKDTIIDKTPNELSDESTSLELLRTPTCCMLSETNEDKFLTPVSNLIADFNFDLLDVNTPPTHVVSDLELSVPEDSGFNSLGLDKSEDSSSDHEGSFQELLQKQKEVSKFLDAKRKSRKLDRVRRLSTLRERGSQSETEEDYNIMLINSEYKLKIARDSASEDSGLVFNEENSGDLVLNLGDLSRTPALQVVCEILRSKRKKPEQNGLLENTERAEMSVLEYILAGLIGKKMGLEKLDILTELKYRDLKHILAIVLGALTVESLCSIWKVSKNWREIVIQDKNAYLRRKLYIKQLKAEAGGCLLHVEDAATRLNILRRSALRPVQAQAKTAVLQTSPYCNELLTPTGCSSVPQSTSKQEEYLKIAKTLFIDEALKPCPRCQCPAKYQPLKKRGLCSREACAFDFCILCLCTFHGSKECSSASAKQRNKKDALPGSAQSKRNLKRL